MKNYKLKTLSKKMEELNTSRIIGYGGESIVFYPGYKNAVS